MTVDNATMKDMEVEADHLGTQFSSITLNSANPSHSNFSECQQVFYDENGFIPKIEFGSVIVVGNLPVVEAEMADELESEIRVVFSEVGVIKQDGFSMPVNPTTQQTLGHCFIEFSSPQDAAVARNERDGYNFGDCRMTVSLYDAFGSVAIPDTGTYSETNTCLNDAFGSVAIPDFGTYSETNASFCATSRYPGSPSYLSPVKEEDEEDEEPIYSDVSTADDHYDIMQWSEQESDMSSDEM